MKHYGVEVPDKFFVVFEEIVLNKAAYNPTHAESFRVEVISEIDLLHTLPYASKPLQGDFHAKIIGRCLLVYSVFEEEGLVLVVDIVDSTQHSKAQRYL